jgi:hypothetical protein
VKDHEQISRRTTALAGFAISRGPQTRAGVDAWRNANLLFRRALRASCAIALAAGFIDGAPGTGAARTRLGDAENAARRDDLAATAAELTRLLLGAFLGPGTVAGLAPSILVSAISFSQPLAASSNSISRS